MEELNDTKIANEILKNLELNQGEKLRVLLMDSLKESYNENIIKNVKDNIVISVRIKSNTFKIENPKTKIELGITAAFID